MIVISCLALVNINGAWAAVSIRTANPLLDNPIDVKSRSAIVRVADPMPTHGIDQHEIRLGMAAPFSGPAKELGHQLKLGIEAALGVANAAGGVNGRTVRLIAGDDGYEPTRTAGVMKELYEKDDVFAFLGNVGTPTAAVALPYVLQQRTVFFGAFTGAPLLRREPPDRYVFNFRASYAEETAAVVRYLVKIRRLRPEQIAVFAQQDGYGDAGYDGVAKIMRVLHPGNDTPPTLRLNYPRNTVDVDEAIAQLQQYQRQHANLPIKAVVMVATYRPAAKFIEKTHDAIPGLIYTNVSFVGSTSLADELVVLGPKFAAGVIVTQVVPAVDSYASVTLEYKTALAKYFPGETPDYVSFEGYLTANVLIEAMRRAGPGLNSETLVRTLESMHGFDMGLGAPINFGPTEHQGVHKVWGTQIGADGHFSPIDLE
jgi:ABC-type branched-subunit amino acid transport system substrate-binding protein